MSESLKILDQAEAEAREAWQWYLRSDRAAARFRDAFESAIENIQCEPSRWPQYLHGTRYFKLKRFPYLVIYRHTEIDIQIIAVAHCHRREGYWKDRSR